MGLPTTTLVGLIVFGLTLFVAVVLPCINNLDGMKPKVIKDESSSDEIAEMYQEVEPVRE